MSELKNIFSRPFQKLMSMARGTPAEESWQVDNPDHQELTEDEQLALVTRQFLDTGHLSQEITDQNVEIFFGTLLEEFLHIAVRSPLPPDIDQRRISEDQHIVYVQIKQADVPATVRALHFFSALIKKNPSYLDSIFSSQFSAAYYARANFEIRKFCLTILETIAALNLKEEPALLPLTDQLRATIAYYTDHDWTKIENDFIGRTTNDPDLWESAYDMLPYPEPPKLDTVFSRRRSLRSTQQTNDRKNYYSSTRRAIFKNAAMLKETTEIEDASIRFRTKVLREVRNELIGKTQLQRQLAIQEAQLSRMNTQQWREKLQVLTDTIAISDADNIVESRARQLSKSLLKVLSSFSQDADVVNKLRTFLDPSRKPSPEYESRLTDFLRGKLWDHDPLFAWLLLPTSLHAKDDISSYLEDVLEVSPVAVLELQKAMLGEIAQFVFNVRTSQSQLHLRTTSYSGNQADDKNIKAQHSYSPKTSNDLSSQVSKWSSHYAYPGTPPSYFFPFVEQAPTTPEQQLHDVKRVINDFSIDKQLQNLIMKAISHGITPDQEYSLDANKEVIPSIPVRHGTVEVSPSTANYTDLPFRYRNTQGNTPWYMDNFMNTIDESSEQEVSAWLSEQKLIPGRRVFSFESFGVAVRPVSGYEVVEVIKDKEKHYAAFHPIADAQFREGLTKTAFARDQDKYEISNIYPEFQANNMASDPYLKRKYLKLAKVIQNSAGMNHDTLSEHILDHAENLYLYWQNKHFYDIPKVNVAPLDQLNFYTSQPECGFNCQNASTMGLHYFKGLGIRCEIMVGRKPFYFDGGIYSNNSGEHSILMITLPNGVVYELDLTPPITDRTPQRVKDFFKNVQPRDKKSHQPLTSLEDKTVHKKKRKTISNLFASGAGISAQALSLRQKNTPQQEQPKKDPPLSVNSQRISLEKKHADQLHDQLVHIMKYIYQDEVNTIDDAEVTQLYERVQNDVKHLAEPGYIPRSIYLLKDRIQDKIAQDIERITFLKRLISTEKAPYQQALSAHTKTIIDNKKAGVVGLLDALSFSTQLEDKIFTYAEQQSYRQQLQDIS